MNKLIEALAGAADGAFIVDQDLEIVDWNQAAQALMGFEKRDVISRPCYQVLHGYDENRQLSCKANCRVAQAALSGRPVHNFDIHFRTKSGEKRWLNISVFTYTRDGDGHKFIVHLLRDVNQKKGREELLLRVLEVARDFLDVLPESDLEKAEDPPPGLLTLRERDVLALMVKGHTTREIGHLLFISPNTVRNHVQHILEKLHVHTRLEAVSYAVKHDLAD